MSKENDTSQEPWEEPAEEDSSEGETQLRQRPRSSRDNYDDPSAHPRQRPRQAGGSRETGRNRPGSYEGRPGRRPGPNRTYDPRQGYDAYGRPRQGTHSPRDSYEYTTEPPRERPRQTHDFHERPDPYDEIDERYHQQHRMSRRSREEAEARLRQRPHQPNYSRDEVNDVYMHPQQRYRPIVDPEIQEFDRRAVRPRPRTRPQTTQFPEKRQRRGWSTLLFGCIGGMMTLALIVGVIAFVLLRSVPLNIGGIGKTSFSKQLAQQSLPITANVTQLQIHNRVGNITIMVDPNATQGTLTGTMKVQAGSNSDADKEFGRIKVDVSPSSDQNALIVNATVPDTSGGLLAGSSDSVDLTIVLPLSVNPNPPFKLGISADIAAAGNISVQNFNGLLTLTDNTGNISVKGGLQAEGSCLQTHVGSITFEGSLTIGTTADTGLIPCTTNTTQNPHPWFAMKSGTGNVNVTLSAETTNLNLDVSTNNGKIISGEFSLNIQQNSDGSASYYGPLTPGTSPTALLALTVSTGNINLHKAT
jgi:hypothetical protein